MPRFLRYEVHPENPQPRLLQHAAAVMRAGGVAALPTAAGWLLACCLDDRVAGARLRRLAGQGPRDPAVLLCRDLAQAAVYLRIDDEAFRAIRRSPPGGEAWLLPCTRRVPRRLPDTALLRFAGHAATQELLRGFDEALLASPVDGDAAMLDSLPADWLNGIDLALDAGPLRRHAEHDEALLTEA